ncbi:unnamed protein product, partial [Brassica oleracea]
MILQVKNSVFIKVRSLEYKPKKREPSILPGKALKMMNSNPLRSCRASLHLLLSSSSHSLTQVRIQSNTKYFNLFYHEDVNNSDILSLCGFVLGCIYRQLIRSFRWLGTWMIGDFFYLVERHVTCGGREMVFTNLIGVDLRLRMVSKLPKKENCFQREKKTLTLSA